MHFYDVSPTVSSSTAYTANNAIGGKQEIGGAFPSYTMLQKVVVIDRDKQNKPMDIVFFAQDFTATTDNQAFAPTATDLLNVIGKVSIASDNYVDLGANGSMVQADGLAMPIKNADGGFIFAQAVTRGTPTHVGTANRLKFRYGFVGKGDI